MSEQNQNHLTGSILLTSIDDECSDSVCGPGKNFEPLDDMVSTGDSILQNRNQAKSSDTVKISQVIRGDSFQPLQTESFYTRLRREVHELVEELDFSVLRGDSKKNNAKSAHAANSRFSLKPLVAFEDGLRSAAKAKKEKCRSKPALRKTSYPTPNESKSVPKTKNLSEVEAKTVSVQVSARKIPKKPRGWMRVENICLSN